MHMRRALRLLGAGLYVAGYGICALVYPLAPTRVRVSLRQGWARGVLKLLGVRMRVDDLKIAPGSLVVANHVSWLDAVVLQGGCSTPRSSPSPKPGAGRCSDSYSRATTPQT